MPENAVQAPAAHKSALHAASTTGPIWRTVHHADAAAAAAYANLAPAQTAGQFCATDNENGGVDGFYFF
jgi:hypothetical protein